MPTKPTPFSEPEYKIPGYTGYIKGLGETYRKTPVMAQVETRTPEPSSFLFTRTVHPKAEPAKDPCNNESSWRDKGEPDNLWPILQAKAAQDSAKPPISNITLGDQRLNPFLTSYGVDFGAPFANHSRLRSPMRNKEIATTTTDLRAYYASSFNRVGEKRLLKMIATMRERMEAKLGNSNDNAFKMRKLFKMYDGAKTGMIHFEDFRMMTESFGMQLDDDSLLALFYVYDPHGTGSMPYEPFVQKLMHPDYFGFYVDNVDITQAKVDMEATQSMMDTLSRSVAPNLGDLRNVLAGLDTDGTGYLPLKTLLSGVASIGIILHDKELAVIMAKVDRDAAGNISYESFCHLFA